MPRKAKKGSPRYYFHQGTENAIIRHNKEDRPHMMNIFVHLSRNLLKTSFTHLSFITLMFQVMMLNTRWLVSYI